MAFDQKKLEHLEAAILALINSLFVECDKIASEIAGAPGFEILNEFRIQGAWYSFKIWRLTVTCQ